MADLGSIAGELYGLELSAFTAERNRRARELRPADRELADAVAALPKPSVAAWLVNQLVREEPDAVGDALALGAGLRAAQTALDREAMRDLGAERRRALGEVAEAARRAAARRARPLSGSVADDVERTVAAGIADAAAADAVRSGRLVRALAAIGSDPVDLRGAVAAPGDELGERAARSRAADPPPAEAARGDHERIRADAEAALDAADRELDAAVERHGELVAQRDNAFTEYERLDRAVGDAERRRREAIRDRDRAQRRADAAARVAARVDGA